MSTIRHESADAALAKSSASTSPPNSGLRRITLGIGMVASLIALSCSWSITGRFLGFSVPQVVVLAFGFLCMALTSSRRWETIRARSLARKIGTCFYMAAVSFLLLDLALRAMQARIAKITSFSGNALSSMSVVTDDRLGHRVAPGSPGHDSAGFRNSSALSSADIVALGDSQTWGEHVRMDEAWPLAVGRLSGLTAYNMGVDGYGPVEYADLAPKAVTLKPRFLVVGFYLGNDLWDASHVVYSRDPFTSLRDAKLAQTLASARAQVSVTAMNKEVADASERMRIDETCWLVVWLSEKSAVCHQLAYRGRWPGLTQRQQFERTRRVIASRPEYGFIYDRHGVRTILTTSYRLAAEDRSLIPIQEGLRLTKQMLEKIAANCVKSHTTPVVLLIPTKERVYSAAMASEARSNPTYQRLLADESANVSELTSWCATRGIQTIDPLPQLQKAVDADVALYAQDADGHPAPAGQLELAKAVSAFVSQQPKR